MDTRQLLRAMELYVGLAYPAGAPAAAASKVAAVRDAAETAALPPGILEKNDVHATGWAVRLGQPLYPHMKIAVDPVGDEILYRVDAHDRHLHAAEGSPDEAWLSQVRKSNQELVEKVETAWEQAGVPTFRGMLRRQLAARRRT